MSLLVETIRTEEGRLLNISFHNERMKRSLYGIFGLKNETDLEKLIVVPEFARKGIYKCRVEYDQKIRKIDFFLYKIKPVNSLKLIENNEIDYRFKFLNREAIDRLMANRGECDDIIIIKNGFVTDSSYANLIFMDRSGNQVTPETFLLKGTRRESMLKQGLITEKKINYSDINKYIKVKLINAMIGLNDTEGIPVGNIE